ncbi:MAG TPA: hypothetical protein VFE62_00425 [Gemmataceae bacterium]|nr:hypothetical protein [Gemmataceae bacterium]
MIEQNCEREDIRVFYENDEQSDPWDTPDDAFSVSVPVSMVHHSSGDIDILVIDLMHQGESGCFAERRIRFSAQAAAQLVDAMTGAVQSGHVLFGDERPAMATLH